MNDSVRGVTANKVTGQAVKARKGNRETDEGNCITHARQGSTHAVRRGRDRPRRRQRHGSSSAVGLVYTRNICVVLGTHWQRLLTAGGGKKMSTGPAGAIGIRAGSL